MGGGATRRAMVQVLVAGLCGACGGATGSPSTPPPDPGPVGAGSGSPGPGPANGAWDPASLDPRIAVSLTGAPSCAGVGPRDPAPPPVRIARPSSTSCGFGGATSDGRGDVAVACLDGRGDRGWNEVFSRDGSQRTTLSAWTLAAPTGAGFTAAYTPFGLRTARQQFVWFDGASWQAASDPDTSAPARFVDANPGAGILEVAWRDASGAGATTRWVDASGNSLRPDRAWPDAIGLTSAGIDDRGRALVTYGTAGAAGTFARWLDQDDTAGAELQVPGADGWERLAGGGLAHQRQSVLPSGSTALEPSPAWLAARTEPMAVVNAGRGYAFVSDGTGAPGCAAKVSLHATDGTSCGTITLTPPDASCPQRTYIGADGTLIQLVQTAQADPQPPASIWRWWPGYLR